MMPLRRVALAAVSLATLAGTACGGGDDDGPATPSNVISAAERADLTVKVSTLRQRLAGTNSAGAEVASALSYAEFALRSGAPIGTVTTPLDAVYHVVVVEVAGVDPFRVVVALNDTVDIAFARGSGTGTLPFSPTSSASGFVWHTPNSLWEATAGSVSAARTGTAGTCTGFTPPTGSTTTCRTATFSAALEIPTSEPVSGTAATGSAAFAFPSAAVGGLYLTP